MAKSQDKQSQTKIRLARLESLIKEIYYQNDLGTYHHTPTAETMLCIIDDTLRKFVGNKPWEPKR